jgi:hypothetical protein
MLDITTTYNVWNIDEEEYRKSQMPYLENQDYQSTERLQPKAQ